MAQQTHIKVYREFFDIGDQHAPIPCEMRCGKTIVDIHHIHSRGLKGFDHNGKHYDINDILNLIGLCRKCHDKAHGGELTKGQLLLRHKYVMLNKEHGYTYK